MRAWLLIVLSVALVAGIVWLASAAQRRTADRAYAEGTTAHALLVAMLDEQAALTRGSAAQDDFIEAERRFERRLAEAELHARDSPAQQDVLRPVTATARG